LTQGRVLLAPLRYGAGIKGKIIDAWKYGCPVVTTSIGAEGIGSDKSEKRNGWGGYVASDNRTFVNDAIRLYTDENEWTRSVSNGRQILKEQFDEKRNFEVLDDAIFEAMENINTRRRRDYISALLWHNSFRSTEYFSKWIELKESFRSSTIEEDNC
jgi:glycosyltransferase involved in cell wall biosynthesis